MNPSTDVDVRVENLTKFYGTSQILNDVSFVVGHGKFFSLLGPSGCGKTTTLRIIGGFVLPDSGNVYIGGKHMQDERPNRRDTNMVFQQLALFPHLTVFDNIAYGLRIKRLPEYEVGTRVNSALDLVRLSGFGGRRIHQLSGGQQQRIAIARAVVNRPRVLLLDEPLGALDLQLRLQMQLELKRIQRELATTFIYVTHDQGEAMTMSDEIAVMKDGCIAQIGTPQEIYESPKSLFVAKFIGDTNILEVVVTETCVPPLGKVTIADGTVVTGRINNPLSKGSKALLSVRHERLRPITGGLRKLSSAVCGTVVSITYRGAYTSYEIRLSTNETVVMNLSEGLPAIRIGSAIQVGWDNSYATILGR